jgi:DNA-binding LacI/PurR family transcriptional regulator
VAGAVRIFVAGASGVIGARLVPLLVSGGHVVAGMTRSAGKTGLLAGLGAEPIVADVFDADALTQAVVSFAPEVAGAVAAVLQHVLGQGFSSPGYVGYRLDSYWDIERENGFRAGLARHGSGGTGDSVLGVDDDASAREAIREFLSSARPDAVLTGNDKIAAVVYGVAAELNLRVGQDVAVTGFGGSIGAGLLHPHLTTVVIPVAELAGRVVGRVLRQLDNGPDSEPGEIVPAALRPAESTSARHATGA